MPRGKSGNTGARAAGAPKKQTAERKTMGDSAEMRGKTRTAGRKTTAGARIAGKKR